jgi:hypothetical protein
MVWLSSRDVTVPAKAMLKSKKLTPRFFGPYQVERFDAPATVKLKWTNNKSKVWPFFHVSRIRPYQQFDPNITTLGPTKDIIALLSGQQRVSSAPVTSTHVMAAVLFMSFYMYTHPYALRYERPPTSIGVSMINNAYSFTTPATSLAPSY